MIYLNTFTKFNESVEEDIQSYLQQGSKDGSLSADYCKLLLNLDNMDLIISSFGGNQTKALKQIKHNREVLDSVRSDVVEMFLNVQYDFKNPLKLVYGYRDPSKNKKIGGADKSSHLRKWAIDIHLNQSNKQDILTLVELSSKHGALGIGVYKDAQDIHLDMDPGLGRRSWGSNYKSSSIPSWAQEAVKNHLSKKYLITKTPRYWDKGEVTQSNTSKRGNTLPYWQPKSGVVFLPTQGKGIPQEESMMALFGLGKENYPWVGLPDGMKIDTSKTPQYVTLTPGGGMDFEYLLDMVNSGKFDSLRPYTIIFVLWNNRRNENAIQSDLKDIMKYLNEKRIDSINPSDLNKVRSILLSK
jgi:hypothetical protein